MAKTVYLGMIGDIMHPGYINIINKATEYGDVIMRLLTTVDFLISLGSKERTLLRASGTYQGWSLRMIGAMSLISLSTSLITSFMATIGWLALTSISVMKYSR